MGAAADRRRYGGWHRLVAELKRDTGRLWERNHGRDDRIVADTSRELRLPFLDEGVVRVLRTARPENLFDPRLGQGAGDKWVVRQVPPPRLECGR